MTNYNKQATDFLLATNTTLEVKEATPQKATNWGKDDKDSHKHINYTVTLKNKNHSYTFDFWGSIKDWEKVNLDGCHYNSLKGQKLHEEVKPNAYDILACLSPMYEDNFTDFCHSFGYDTDSISAHKIYTDVMEQDRNLRKLFTHEEFDLLAEIN